MGDDSVDGLIVQARTFEELIYGLVEAEDSELEGFLPVHLEVEFLDLGPIDLQWIRVPSATPQDRGGVPARAVGVEVLGKDPPCTLASPQDASPRPIAHQDERVGILIVQGARRDFGANDERVLIDSLGEIERANMD